MTDKSQTTSEQLQSQYWEGFREGTVTAVASILITLYVIVMVTHGDAMKMARGNGSIYPPRETFDAKQDAYNQVAAKDGTAQRCTGPSPCYLKGGILSHKRPDGWPLPPPPRESHW